MTVVTVTRLAPGAMRSPRELEASNAMSETDPGRAPEANWLHNFAVLGPCDYVDGHQDLVAIDQRRG